MSAAEKASEPSPRSSGESASSEAGSPGNKGSVSGLQAISSKTQSMSTELAMASKTPHRGKPPLASRLQAFSKVLFQSSTVHHASYHNKHRSEHVRDRELNGSADGEASKQIQSQDILKSENKMKHLFTRTNTEEITDSERPSNDETVDDFLGGAAAVPQLPTFDKLPSESEEEKEKNSKLLEESSGVEEGRLCRFCFGCDAPPPSNPLLSPCLCSGSVGFVHLDCLKAWLWTRLQSGLHLDAAQKCELCKGKLTLDPNIFNWKSFFERYYQQIDYIPAMFHPRDTPRFVAYLRPLYRADTHTYSRTFGGFRRTWTPLPNTFKD